MTDTLATASKEAQPINGHCTALDRTSEVRTTRENRTGKSTSDRGPAFSYIPAIASLCIGGGSTAVTQGARNSLTMKTLLDQSHEQIRAGSFKLGFGSLIAGLTGIRSTSAPAEWKELINQVCRTHPICAAMQLDPFTRRSLTKPRGYAGDAVMMDMIYRRDSDELNGNELGQFIFRHTTGAGQEARAVRYRRTLIAKMVDELAEQTDKARILSIASGHLREAELSKALKEGAVDEWLALDQDPESLQECARSYGNGPVRVMKTSVRHILAGKLDVGQFDLVYSAGLFDYLSKPVAEKLTGRMLSLLKPNGKLLIANFLEGLENAAYMEAFMGWNLIYRTEEDMKGLLGTLDASSAGSHSTFIDPIRAVAYATAVR
ncbi:MAG: methyltransferase domain-containing protein [Terracidiphilus sp.]